MTTTVTGPDPYVCGPGELQIESERYGYVVIRMRNTHDTAAEFFWTTTQQSNFIAGLEYGFTLIPDGEFHIYEVPVWKSDKWQGTITRLRLDPGEGSEQAVADGAEVEIDYIRVAHLGPRLEIMSFSANQQVISPTDTIGLVLQVINSGDEEIEGATTQLTIPSGLSLIDGGLTKPIPAMAPNDEYSVEWQVSPQDTGIYLAQIAVRFAGQADLIDTCRFKVSKPIPEFPPEIPAVARSFMLPEGHLILENSRIRLAFINNDSEMAQRKRRVS